MNLETAYKTVYEVIHSLRQLWGRLMPEEYSDDRLIFRLSSEDAVELDKLSDGFAGLARQFRRHLEDNDLNPDQVPSKLVVTDLKSSSIEFELATLAALYGYMHMAADGYVIWTDFYTRIKGTLDYLVGKGERPSKYDIDDAKDFDAFLGTIAGKRGSALRVRRARFRRRSGQRETVAEFDFDEQDVTNAHMKLGAELTGLDEHQEADSARHRLSRRVRFVWHRTDREKGRQSGQTSDRGVIEEITNKPLPVFFASEADNYKDKMTKTRINPFDIVYLVDVSVAYDENNEPKTYTIMNIHNIHDAA